MVRCAGVANMACVVVVIRSSRGFCDTVLLRGGVPVGDVFGVTLGEDVVVLVLVIRCGVPHEGLAANPRPRRCPLNGFGVHLNDECSAGASFGDCGGVNCGVPVGDVFDGAIKLRVVDF